MNKQNDFSYVKVKNQENKYIIDKFIEYYKFIYSNYTTMGKTPKEIYYKLATIKRTIDSISKYTKKIISGSQLEKIRGIGPKTIGRIDEIVKTGNLSELEDQDQKYESIEQLSKIYGIGPVKASEFYHQYKISNLKDLISADKKGTITLTHQMKLGIKYADTLVEKIPRELILQAQKKILDKIVSVDPDIISTICGSFRRQKPYSSDIDILLTHKKISQTNNKQGYYLNKVVSVLDDYFIVDKLTESSNKHFQGFASFSNIVKKFPNFDVVNSVIRVDIIIVPYCSYHTALMHFTGSAVFNQKMRLHAKSMGMKLSEYGLYEVSGEEEKPIKIKSEEDIFNNLLLKYIPPEKR
jgi:DNA polymerase/3'-5' exonuclease PolX